MRKLSSSNLAASAAISLLFLSPSPGKAEEVYISDEALSKEFTARCTALIEVGNYVEGDEVRETLKRELRHSKPLFTSLPTADSKPNSKSAIQTAADATVIVGHLYLCGKCDNWHNNLAGGVVISPDGLLITNYHVLKFAQAKTFAAMTKDGRIFPIAKVLASSKKNDVALVQLKGAKNLAYAPVAKSGSTGDDLFVISHPDGHFYSFTKGHISRYFIDPASRARRIQITAPFARGSSGSGIFNERGEIIGLATFTNTIFYEEKESKNPQTVLYTGVPSASILKLGAEE